MVLYAFISMTIALLDSGTTVGVAAPGHQWAGCSRAVSDNGQEEGRVGRWGG